MITTRDMSVISFVQKMKIVPTGVLQKLFYKNKRVAQTRLKMLVECGELNRKRSPYSNEYLFYIEDAHNLDGEEFYGHFLEKLILVKFYCQLSKLVQIIDFEHDYQIKENFIDGITSFIYNEKQYVGLLDVKKGTKKLTKENSSYYQRDSLKKSDLLKSYVKLRSEAARTFPFAKVFVAQLSEEGIWILDENKEELKRICEDTSNLEELLEYL